MQSKPSVPARWFRSFVPNLLFGLLVGALTSARAASPSIWNGGGANDYWNNATNWGGNIPVPDTAYDLQFGGMTRLTPVNDFPAASNFRHLTFNADAGAFNLGGNSITLNGHITNNSTSLQTINLPISTGAGRYVATTAGNITFGGAISGNGGLHLAGPGAVTLSGQNSFTNYLYVNGGILNLPTGASISNRWYVFAGQTAAHSGAINITGGTLTNTLASGSTGSLMIGRAGYGALSMSSGTVRVNYVNIGWTGGMGLVSISGGNFYCGGTGGDYVVIGTSTAPSTGVLTVSGTGFFSHANVNRTISVNNNADARGEINVLGGTLNNAGGAVSFGYNSALNALGSGAGIVNLNAGTLTLNRFVNKSANAGPTGSSYVNFNGGTLTASASTLTSPNLAFSSNFIPAAIEVRVNGAFGSYTGGAVIDTAGQDCLVEPALLAPTGSGIASVPVTDGGAGYIGAPYSFDHGRRHWGNCYRKHGGRRHGQGNV